MVKVYVPAALIVGVAVAAPLSIVPVPVVHAYVNTPCPDEPVPSNTKVVTAQVNSASVPASAVGANMSSVITTSAEVTVQPLSLSVTTTL